MVHQTEEERQVLARHALLIQRQDVVALADLQQVVGVLDALGDALARHHRADAVTGDEGFELVVRDFGVDRHGDRTLSLSRHAAG
jgi:hypothetical protein